MFAYTSAAASSNSVNLFANAKVVNSQGFVVASANIFGVASLENAYTGSVLATSYHSGTGKVYWDLSVLGTAGSCYIPFLTVRSDDFDRHVSNQAACIQAGGGGGDPGGCGSLAPYGTSQFIPIVISCDPDNPDPCCSSPILFDLDGRGFRLCAAADGVRFDVNADGIAEQTAWTASEGGDAFLVLDRDGDGAFTSGLEMFGNFTISALTGERAPNGYEALAAFDDPSLGGNGDGVIDSHDDVFSRLQLWRDDNHDGVSQADEIFSLSSAGIVTVEVSYHKSARRDAYGNAFRYEGRAWRRDDSGQGRPIKTSDVFFVRER